MPKNKVFIATSIDGYIADKDGNIDWLHAIPNPDGIDMGYQQFMDSVDALVMGRKTFDVVMGFGIPWPYTKPVFVVSSSLGGIPSELSDKEVHLIQGTPQQIVEKAHAMGYFNLYIDGGNVIRQFLDAGLIHEMILTTIPVLLAGGTRLFNALEQPQHFKCIGTQLLLDCVPQVHYVQKNAP